MKSLKQSYHTHSETSLSRACTAKCWSFYPEKFSHVYFGSLSFLFLQCVKDSRTYKDPREVQVLDNILRNQSLQKYSIIAQLAKKPPKCTTDFILLNQSMLYFDQTSHSRATLTHKSQEMKGEKQSTVIMLQELCISINSKQ